MLLPPKPLFLLLLVLVLVAASGQEVYKEIEGRQRNLVGGEENVPTMEPTTSQPTGFSAPSVPKDIELNIPLVDLPAAPSLPMPVSQQEGIMRQYAQKRADIAGSMDVNQELASETTTAMNSVAYIFVTFVGLVLLVGSVYLYKSQCGTNQRDGAKAYQLVDSTDSIDHDDRSGSFVPSKSSSGLGGLELRSGSSTLPRTSPGR